MFLRASATAPACHSAKSLADYDPEKEAAFLNEVMAEDDANDPLLDSYQHYRKAP